MLLLMVEVSGIEGVRLAVVIGPQHNRLYQIKGDLHYVYPVKYSTIHIRPNLVFHALELNNSMVENNNSTIYTARALSTGKSHPTTCMAELQMELGPHLHESEVPSSYR